MENQQSPESFAVAISVPLQGALALGFFALPSQFCCSGCCSIFLALWEQDYLRLAQASQLRLSQSELEVRIPFERTQAKLLFSSGEFLQSCNCRQCFTTLASVLEVLQTLVNLHWFLPHV